MTKLQFLKKKDASWTIRFVVILNRFIPRNHLESRHKLQSIAVLCKIIFHYKSTDCLPIYNRKPITHVYWGRSNQFSIKLSRCHVRGHISSFHVWLTKSLEWNFTTVLLLKMIIQLYCHVELIHFAFYHKKNELSFCQSDHSFSSLEVIYRWV